MIRCFLPLAMTMIAVTSKLSPVGHLVVISLLMTGPQEQYLTFVWVFVTQMLLHILFCHHKVVMLGGCKLGSEYFLYFIGS